MRVPGSTSNLGAGFDCIGLALDRYLDASFEPGGDGLVVERAGTLAAVPVGVAGDAVVAAFVSALGLRRDSELRGVFRMTSTIPVARGLGSSAAATVAGLLLAAVARDERPEPDTVVRAAAAIEGHPDNSAPSLLGGLIGVAQAAGGLRTFRLPLSDALGFAFASPAVEVSTAEARRALPAAVPHAVAVRALGRTAALLHGLATADPDLLRAGFQDELHVPYRLPLIPGAAAVFEAALAAGAHAVTISGSGSGLIAVSARDRADAVAAAMAAAFRDRGDPEGVVAMALAPDFDGAMLLETP